MSSGLKVLVACLAVFGVIAVVCMLIGLLNWIIIGIVVVGALVIAARAIGSSRRKGLIGADRKVFRQMRRLEKKIDSIRKP